VYIVILKEKSRFFVMVSTLWYTPVTEIRSYFMIFFKIIHKFARYWLPANANIVIEIAIYNKHKCIYIILLQNAKLYTVIEYKQMFKRELYRLDIFKLSTIVLFVLYENVNRDLKSKNDHIDFNHKTLKNDQNNCNFKTLFTVIYNLK